MDTAATRVDGQRGLAAVDRAGLEDFWNVYDANYDEISNEALRGLADDAEFGPILQGMSEQQAEDQNRESREKLGRAIRDGNWEEYFTYLRVQGATYAQTRMPR